MFVTLSIKKILFLFLSVVTAAGFTGCRRQQQVETDPGRPSERIVSAKETETEKASPVELTQPDIPVLKENRSPPAEYRKPFIPEGVKAEKILSSKPIPGIPVMIIYRFREIDGVAADTLPEGNSTSKTEDENRIEPQPVIKPEPAAVMVEEKDWNRRILKNQPNRFL